jgi:uncharacterized protein (TIGR00725 family)
MDAMPRKLPIIGVFGHGTPIEADLARLAREVGTLVARVGGHLLSGAGYGVMEAAAEGFTSVADRAGWSIGIVPRDPDGPFNAPYRDIDGRAYPNRFVEIAIMTPLPPLASDWRHEPSRNHINVLTPDVIIALPGNRGTHNELDMSAEYRGEASGPREQRRVVLIGPAEQFMSRHRELFVHAQTVGEAETHVRRMLAARGFERGKQP